MHSPVSSLRTQAPALRSLAVHTALLAILSLIGCGEKATENTAPPPTVTSVAVTSSSVTLIALGETVQLEASARDQNGAAMAGQAFTWSSSDETVASVGEAGLVTAVGNGTATITATTAGVAGTATATVAQVATQLAFTEQPSETLAGEVIAPAVAVTIQDANGHTVASASDEVTLALGTTSEGEAGLEAPTTVAAPIGVAALAEGELGGTTTVVAVAGVATFDDLIIDKTGSGYTLMASAGELQGATSEAFTVTPAEAVALVFRVQPTDAVAGAAVAPAVEVVLLDEHENAVTDAANAVTLGLADNPGGGTLGGTKTVSADAGVALFDDLWVDKAASGYTLVASAGDLPDVTSAAFAIAPAQPAVLLFQQEPTDATAGVAVDPSIVVRIEDTFGNTVPTATHTVTLTIETNPGGGTLAGSAIKDAAAAVATFDDIWIDKSASGYTLSASADNLTSATSAAFAISPAAAEKLGFVATPPNTGANETMSPAVEVAIQDAFGNTVPAATDQVTVAIETDAGGGPGGVLDGTLMQTAVEGVASFDGLSIDQTGFGYTLQATAGGLTSASSASFDIFGRWVAVTLGQFHTCSVASDGTVRCWGSGGARLGYSHNNDIGDNESPASAGDVNVGGTVTQMGAGHDHTCALLNTGAVRCWGGGFGGKLGYGNTNTIGDNEDPAAAGDVPVGGTVTQFDAGGITSHTCAVLSTRAVRCWGDAFSGQLGYSNTDPIGDDETPSSTGDVDVGGTVAQVALGADHTCALLANGAVRCWGSGGSGRLGYGNTDNIGDNETPASAGDVNVGGTVTQIAAGADYTCALLTTGAVRCWGQNNLGQLGYGNTDDIGDNETPASAGDVNVGGTVTQIAAGLEHTCALLTSGAVRCWGSGGSGRLGYGNTTTIGDNETPASAGDVAVGGTVTHIGAGWEHTCAVITTGAVRCWGWGGNGELGYGNTTTIGDNETPASVGDVKNSGNP
jgi:alpha-tubulin suppressor-like RCC1 family protein